MHSRGPHTVTAGAGARWPGSVRVSPGPGPGAGPPGDLMDAVQPGRGRRICCIYTSSCKKAVINVSHSMSRRWPGDGLPRPDSDSFPPGPVTVTSPQAPVTFANGFKFSVN
jgi:hypothetical protein